MVIPDLSQTNLDMLTVLVSRPCWLTRSITIWPIRMETMQREQRRPHNIRLWQVGTVTVEFGPCASPPPDHPTRRYAQSLAAEAVSPRRPIVRRSCFLVAHVTVAGERLGYTCVRRVRLRPSLSWTFPPQNSGGAASAAFFTLGPVAISSPALIRRLPVRRLLVRAGIHTASVGAAESHRFAQ